jgi:PhnB protein
MSVYVEDVDSVFARAVKAGAKALRPVEDPFGHRWSVATHVEDVSPDEMAKRAEAMGG